MIWILHAVAALAFWPALFITIPAHMILNRFPPKVSPEDVAHDPSDVPQPFTTGQAIAIALALSAAFWVLEASGLL